MLERYLARVQGCISQYLQTLSQDINDHSPSQFKAAMSYCLATPGKRIRPALTFAIGELLAAHPQILLQAAAAVELIHTYSLIHDDLPAMDNDDLRRGRATCHVVYDDATAILCGDALQSLAFEQLTTAYADFPSQRQLLMLQKLAQAAGTNGMVAGQAIDMTVNKPANEQTLETMHKLKTGALLQVALELGVLASTHANENDLLAAQTFGQALGLAFQVQDDIIDVTSDSQTLGKPASSDINEDKLTFVSVLGLDTAIKRRNEYHDQALSALQAFTGDTKVLAALAEFVINRNC